MKVLAIFSVLLAMAYAAPNVVVSGNLEIEERTFERIDAIIDKTEKYANDEVARAEKQGNLIIERALSLFPNINLPKDQADLERIVLQAGANIEKKITDAGAEVNQLVGSVLKEIGNGNRYTAATIAAGKRKINNILNDAEKDIDNIVLQTVGNLKKLYNETANQLESLDVNYPRHATRQQTINKMDKLIQNAESRANKDIQDGENLINKEVARDEKEARDVVQQALYATTR